MTDYLWGCPAKGAPCGDYKQTRLVQVGESAGDLDAGCVAAQHGVDHPRKPPGYRRARFR